VRRDADPSARTCPKRRSASSCRTLRAWRCDFERSTRKRGSGRASIES